MVDTIGVEPLELPLRGLLVGVKVAVFELDNVLAVCEEVESLRGLKLGVVVETVLLVIIDSLSVEIDWLPEVVPVVPVHVEVAELSEMKEPPEDDVLLKIKLDVGPVR